MFVCWHMCSRQASTERWGQLTVALTAVAGEPGMVEGTVPNEVGVVNDTPTLVLEGGIRVEGSAGGSVSPPWARDINFIAYREKPMFNTI